jgi:hypothetical protein
MGFFTFLILLFFGYVILDIAHTIITNYKGDNHDN